MTGQSFRDAELEGWDRKAGYWDDSLGTVTLSAIDPLLDSVEAAPGVRILDIACGTGALPPQQPGVAPKSLEWISPQP